jgi:hypothetical protein
VPGFPGPLRSACGVSPSPPPVLWNEKVAENPARYLLSKSLYWQNVPDKGLSVRRDCPLGTRAARQLRLQSGRDARAIVIRSGVMVEHLNVGKQHFAHAVATRRRYCRAKSLVLKAVSLPHSIAESAIE